MRSVRMPRWGLLILAAFTWLPASSAHAQQDLEKQLVGRWDGEVSTRQAKNVTTVVLTIKSLKEEGGKWTAEALAGRNLVNLENEKTMVGTVTLTTASGGSRGDRDRPVKLEKVEKK